MVQINAIIFYNCGCRWEERYYSRNETYSGRVIPVAGCKYHDHPLSPGHPYPKYNPPQGDEIVLKEIVEEE